MGRHAAERRPVLTAPSRERLRSAALVAAVHAALGYALLSGLGVTLTRTPEERLIAFDLIPPAPPPDPPAPAPAEMREAEGEAAPPAARARPAPVVAPPIVRLPPPIPVVAAPVAGVFDEPAAGAAETPGPGTGAGGVGDGLGAGGAGSGTGAGGGGGSPARKLRGELRNSDYPRDAVRARAQGTVVVHLQIGPNGRVRACEVARSSGNGTLDETTCRLIARRFRYEPARDAEGRPTTATLGWRQTWWLEGPR